MQLSDCFPINKKKTTQTFIHHFFLPKQQHLSRMIESQFYPQMECNFYGIYWTFRALQRSYLDQVDRSHERFTNSMLTTSMYLEVVDALTSGVEL